MNSDATCLTAGGHFGRRIFWKGIGISDSVMTESPVRIAHD